MAFEDKLKTLEEIVQKMGSGDMKLDEMIKAYEEGQKLVADCSKELEAIRLRIEKVTKSGEVEELKK
jgi:exodeoxyribonuclease VII small subunit